MDYFAEFVVGYLRYKLLFLIEREPVCFEDFHILVQDLLDLQEEFQALVNLIDLTESLRVLN